jgi:phosphopantetheine adenylyltransferase
MRKILLCLVPAAILAVGCQGAEAAGKTPEQYKDEAMSAYQVLERTPIVEIAESKSAIIDSARAHVPTLTISKVSQSVYLAKSHFNRAKAEADTIQRGLTQGSDLDRVNRDMRNDLDRAHLATTYFMGEKQADAYIGAKIIREGVSRSGGQLTIVPTAQFRAMNRELASLRSSRATKTAKLVKAVKPATLHAKHLKKKV